MHRTPVLLFRSAVPILWNLESAGGHETSTIKKLELDKSKRGSWSSFKFTGPII